MKNPESRIGTSGWLAVGLFVAAFDTLAHETMTNAFKRGRESDNHFIRCATIGGLAVTAAHLMDWIPEKYDPIDRLATGVGKLIMRKAVNDIHIP